MKGPHETDSEGNKTMEQNFGWVAGVQRGVLRSSMLRVAASFVGLMLLGSPNANAGGTSAAGYTSGLPIYAIFPKGLYYINQHQSNEREVGNIDIRTNTNIFFFYYQSAWEVADGAVSFVVAPTVFDLTTTGGVHEVGFYNTYFASQISWELADGLYFGGRLGGYIPQEGDFALDYGTIEPRFGLTYLNGGWQATANFVFGMPVGGSGPDIAPNYFFVDFSVTKAFGKWTFGVVGHASKDLNSPFPSYNEQSQFALGGLAAYDFSGATLQVKLTSDVTEENYGGKETALWTNLIVPVKF